MRSIKIRVETISYFLKRYREDMVRDGQKRTQVAEEVRLYEQALREAMAKGQSVDEVDIETIVRQVEAQKTPAPQGASEAALTAAGARKK